MPDECRIREEELDRLRERFERHVEDYRMHILEHDHREQKLLEAQENNTQHIKELTEATKGLVDAWNAARAFQKFVKWVTGFSGIAVLIAWWNDIFKLGGGN